MVKTRFNQDHIWKAARTANENRLRRASVVATSVLIFVLLALSTNLQWHIQTLQSGIAYWDDALINSIISVSLGGTGTVLLSLGYALLSGIVLTNIGIQIANRNIVAKEIGSIIPGFVATGCASCGLGVTGLLGFAGATALLPFNGDLLKFLSIVLLVYALHELGKSPVCQLSSGGN